MFYAFQENSMMLSFENHSSRLEVLKLVHAGLTWGASTLLQPGFQPQGLCLAGIDEAWDLGVFKISGELMGRQVWELQGQTVINFFPIPVMCVYMCVCGLNHFSHVVMSDSIESDICNPMD